MLMIMETQRKEEKEKEKEQNHLTHPDQKKFQTEQKELSLKEGDLAIDCLMEIL